MRRAFSEVVVCQTDLTTRDCIRAASVVKGRKWAGGSCGYRRRAVLLSRKKVAAFLYWSHWLRPARFPEPRVGRRRGSGFVEPMRSQARTGFAAAIAGRAHCAHAPAAAEQLVIARRSVGTRRRASVSAAVCTERAEVRGYPDKRRRAVSGGGFAALVSRPPGGPAIDRERFGALGLCCPVCR